jgi:hypothetical protein
MRPLALLGLAAISACAGLACSATESVAPLPIPCTPVVPDGGVPLLGSDCDPLVPTQCGFPFPSNVYLRDDPTTPTGKRVALGATTLPTYGASGPHIDASLWNDSDGFSPGQDALVHLPGATVTGLPTQDTIASSIDPSSPTILLNADTGELVPHFSEIDESITTEDDRERTLMIRPVVRLDDARRYIVAIRHVVDAGGKALDPTPAFKALRDGEDSCEPSVVARRALYEDIFARLEKAGVPRGDLQIAWDYTTASRANNTARMLYLRDDALAKVGADGPAYVVDLVEENPNPHIRRRISGRMTVPLYLDQQGPGGKLLLDDHGVPIQNGTTEFPFVVHIPNAATKGTPGALLQNGHGLFSTLAEGEDDYLALIADTKDYVAFSVNLDGMSAADAYTVLTSLVTDVGGFKDNVGRTQQGMVNELLAMRMMMGRFAKDPLTIIDGKPTIDPTERHYRGDSQGGIFGTTYMTLTTDVTRGLVSVPGMPFSLLLDRSVDFTPFFIVIRSAFPSGREIQLLIGLMQMLWDRVEPDGYAPYLKGHTLPGTPAHEVLIHVGIGDYQVTPLGAHIIARTVGAKNLAPVNRHVWGVPEASAPIQGSAMVEFSFGLPPAPETDVPPSGPPEKDPHQLVRSLPDAIDQEDTFFRTGVVKAYCDGPCDPE